MLMYMMYTVYYLLVYHGDPAIYMIYLLNVDVHDVFSIYLHVLVYHGDPAIYLLNVDVHDVYSILSTCLPW